MALADLLAGVDPLRLEVGWHEDDRLSSGAPLHPKWFAVAFLASTALFVVNATLTCIALALHEGTSINRMMALMLFLSVRTINRYD